MAKYNRPNGKLFGSSATNIGVFGSGQQNETPTTSTDPNTINGLGTHWEEGWNGAVVSQAPYTAPYVEDMNAVNYVNSYNSAYLLQRGIPEYSATEEYQEDSVCTYSGEIWICLQDNTVGQTPSEGAYWHLQGEIPPMGDNTLLVGAVGNVPTVVATDNQGDVLASASGLDIKSNTIINADINSNAAIDESKLNLTYSTSSLNTSIGNVAGDLSNHTSDTANPHVTTISNLDDTNVTGLQNEDILSYDLVNSEWINKANTLSNISDTSISSPANYDVLEYYNGNWSNSDKLTNLGSTVNGHITDTSNPHDTTLDNLDDTVITTASDGDTVLFDGNDSKWKNIPNTLDNLSNVTLTSPSTGDIVSFDGSNWINSTPPGGALSTLTDTTISTPTDKQLLQYDYANSKWVNSSDVWTQIEVNDIANINGATTNITLTANDKRHQIFTSTTGFTITLPSTGIKAGEKFIFDWSNPTITSTFTINASDNSNVMYVSTGACREIYTAKVNNPSTSTDWIHKWIIINSLVKSGSSNAISWTSVANTRVERTSSTLITLAPGLWEVEFTGNLILTGGALSDLTIMGLVNSGGIIAMRSVSSSFGWGGAVAIPIGSGATYTVFGKTVNAWIYGNMSSSGVYRCAKYTDPIWGGLSCKLSVAATHYACYTAHATFVAPINTNV